MSRLYVQTFSQWREWNLTDRPYMNWMNLDLFHLGFEHAPYKTATEVQLTVFGLILVVGWYWGEPTQEDRPANWQHDDKSLCWSCNYYGAGPHQSWCRTQEDRER